MKDVLLGSTCLMGHCKRCQYKFPEPFFCGEILYADKGIVCTLKNSSVSDISNKKILLVIALLVSRLDLNPGAIVVDAPVRMYQCGGGAGP